MVRYAGPRRRLAAFVIDSLILLILTMLLSLLFAEPSALASDAFQWRELLIHDLLPMALIIFCWTRYRATPGKELLDCEVVDANTLGNLPPGRALLRYLGYIISLLPLGIGFLWMIWDGKHRAFHDYLANSVVILSEREPLAEQPLERLLREVV